MKSLLKPGTQKRLGRYTYGAQLDMRVTPRLISHRIYLAHGNCQIQATTDDHGMHVTGLVKDQKGTKYFIVKNSWGFKHNDLDGYFYASFPYVKYKTMNIQIHKDAIPANIKKKLGLK